MLIAEPQSFSNPCWFVVKDLRFLKGFRRILEPSDLRVAIQVCTPIYIARAREFI